MNRRAFLRTAGGATAVAAGGAAASAPASAQDEGGGGGGNKSGGGGGGNKSSGGGGGNKSSGGGGGGGQQKTVTVGPGGNLKFDPETVYVKKGGTVVWKWDSDNHNIVVESQPDGANWKGHESIENAGFTYKHTFNTNGEYAYYCQPHKSAGMEGKVVVNKSGQKPGGGGGGGETDPEHMGVPIRAHYVGIGALLSVMVSLVFAFFQLKYSESPHASGGNN